MHIHLTAVRKDFIQILGPRICIRECSMVTMLNTQFVRGHEVAEHVNECISNGRDTGKVLDTGCAGPGM